MVLILADTPRDGEAIRRAAGGTARVVESTPELTDHGASADCLIIACRRRFPGDRVQLLREVARTLPWVPLILVTDREAGAARLLRDLPVSAVVWFSDLEAHLQPRIELARGTATLWHMAESFRRSAAPPALRRALIHSLRRATSRPVLTVRQLALAVGRSPVTLFQQFGALARGRTTLNRFLSALLLFRAHQLRETGLSWKAVCERLGVRRDTLNRKAKAWPGRSLTDLERMNSEELLLTLTADHLRPLFDPALPGAGGRHPPPTAPPGTDTAPSAGPPAPPDPPN
ncbi:hypothetical protein [Candidatus Palauibacter sp.]|uniref:hypothetical protein n=1 Tax=Candidatus Palauibacter sp. TaxID=3101350 RepID=UPI003B02B5CC